jgi:hypothetical protein
MQSIARRAQTSQPRVMASERKFVFISKWPSGLLCAHKPSFQNGRLHTDLHFKMAVWASMCTQTFISKWPSAHKPSFQNGRLGFYVHTNQADTNSNHSHIRLSAVAVRRRISVAQWCVSWRKWAMACTKAEGCSWWTQCPALSSANVAWGKCAWMTALSCGRRT